MQVNHFPPCEGIVYSVRRLQPYIMNVERLLPKTVGSSETKLSSNVKEKGREENMATSKKAKPSMEARNSNKQQNSTIT